MYQANQIDKTRPQMPVPNELRQAEALADERASRSLFPGQEHAESLLEGTTANLTAGMQSAAGSSSELVGAVQAGAMAENRGKQQLSQKALEYRYQAEQEAIRMKQVVSDYLMKQFDVNQMQPYLQRAETARQLFGAGIQNIGNAAAGFANASLTEKYIDRIGINGAAAGVTKTEEGAPIQYMNLFSPQLGSSNGTSEYDLPVMGYNPWPEKASYSNFFTR